MCASHCRCRTEPIMQLMSSPNAAGRSSMTWIFRKVAHSACEEGFVRRAARHSSKTRCSQCGRRLDGRTFMEDVLLVAFLVAPSTCEQVHDHQGSSVQAFRFVRCWCVGHTRRRSSCIHSTGQTDTAKILEYRRSGQSRLPESEAWGNHAGSSVPYRSSTCSWQRRHF